MAKKKIHTDEDLDAAYEQGKKDERERLKNLIDEEDDDDDCDDEDFDDEDED